jgi:hypothetical protein
MSRFGSLLGKHWIKGWTFIVVSAAPLYAAEVQPSTGTASLLPGMQVSTSTSNTPEMTAPAAPSPPASSAPALPASLNEMTGSLQTIDAEGGLLRITSDDGFNVEFSFDIKTICLDTDKKALGFDDLEYGDRVRIRYLGRELHALEIDRLPKKS